MQLSTLLQDHSRPLSVCYYMQKRQLLGKSISELEQLFWKTSGNREQLGQLAHELEHRKTRRAWKLADLVAKALECASSGRDDASDFEPEEVSKVSPGESRRNDPSTADPGNQKEGSFPFSCGRSERASWDREPEVFSGDLHSRSRLSGPPDVSEPPQLDQRTTAAEPSTASALPSFGRTTTEEVFGVLGALSMPCHLNLSETWRSCRRRSASGC